MGLFSTPKKADVEQPVQVHHTAGCDLCGKTGRHTHGQAEWRELIDSVVLPSGQKPKS